MKKYLLAFTLFFATVYANAQTCVTTYGQVTVNTTCDALQSNPYYYNGVQYRWGGTYTVSLINYKGCDSVVTLTINARTPGSSYTNMTVKKCQLPMFWKCQDIFQAGQYSCAWDVGNPECGDSVDYLNLTVIPNDTVKIYDTICWGGLPYQWHYRNLDASGVYWENVGGSNACYTEELHLTIYEPKESYTNITVCQSQLPYNWNGKLLTEEGYGSVKIENGTYCDSFAVVYLTVVPNTTSSTNVTVCANQLPYLWNGQSLSASGTYKAAIAHAGCDSIATLNLTVKPVPVINSFSPTSGSQGQAVVITGSGLTGATAVSFGGTPAASFTVQSAASIIATVAAQGTSGAVTVTTNCSTASLGGFSFNSNSGNIGIGTNSAPSKLTIGGGDVNIQDVGSGIILKSPDGSCWRVTIDNNGTLVRTKITCPQ